MQNELSILVAEDDPNDAFFLKRAFALAGLEATVRFVSDGEEAINYLQQKPTLVQEEASSPLHLMVLDIKMPRLGGFEVLAWVRRQALFEHVPVAVLSSSNLDEDVQQAYALGADLYEVKPNDPVNMVALAKRLGRMATHLAESSTVRMRAKGFSPGDMICGVQRTEDL